MEKNYNVSHGLSLVGLWLPRHLKHILRSATIYSFDDVKFRGSNVDQTSSTISDDIISLKMKNSSLI